MALQAAETALEAAPRVGPVLSATDAIEGAYWASERAGIDLYPWQDWALGAMYQTNADQTWRFREVAIIVARQNGKSKLIVPRVVDGLFSGEHVVHTAQNRVLPRQAFKQIADIAQRIEPGTYVRTANGQEEVAVPGSGSYRIIAPQSGARGLSADLLIIDELREFDTFDFIAAAEPILTASPNPQVLYLSNAGAEDSVVLNDLRNRAEDPDLAYLEWSAAPEYDAHDHRGWYQANPSIGYSNLTIERLEGFYRKYEQSGEMAIFETEHLCRWVRSMAPRLVMDSHWQHARGPLEPILRPSMGIATDPSGTRADVALAWPQSDGTIGLMLAIHGTGSPIDIGSLAEDALQIVKRHGVMDVGYDPATDKHLARYFEEAISLSQQDMANASERFVRTIEIGQLRWQSADAISADLPNAIRKSAGNRLTWTADRAKAERPITAVLAAIRAVWLASKPRELVPSVY